MIENEHLRILSGVDYIAKDVANQLDVLGWPKTSAANLLLDRPVGWVVLREQRLLVPGSLVATDNNCPEYLREIRSMEPLQIIHGVTAKTIAELRNLGIEEISEVTSVNLSPAESRVLKLAVEGNSNKSIARLRNVSEGTVENMLGSIYRKLGLKTRVDLVHYFYGNWHLLDERYSSYTGRG